MPTNIKQQPLPISLPGLRALSYGTATAMPIGISRDRKTLFGAAGGSGTTLYQSVDDGATWTSVKVFTENVTGALETDDGECLVTTINGASTPGYLYKSSGWTASHTTATWTKTLTTTGGYIRPIWSAHAFTFGNDLITAGTSRYGVTNEYGGQTTASGDQSGKGCRAYFTSDYGATWTLIIDLSVRYPGVANLHVHASAYDPYWDRIWLTYGDAQAEAAVNGVTRQALLYSDDHGATWNTLGIPAEFSDYIQSTPIAVLKDSILLGSDNAPGYFRMGRKGYRSISSPQVLAVAAGGTSTWIIASGIHQNRNSPGAPIVTGFVSVTTEGAQGALLVGSESTTLTEVWRDNTLINNGLGPIGAFGPTANGVIVADVLKTGTTHWQLRGEMVYPDPGQWDGLATFTGDGTTTVFNVAHNLPTTPTRYQAWTTNTLGGAFTLTVTSTNLVFTFTTAPGAGVLPQVAYRYGV